jgi:hypothetical protein
MPADLSKTGHLRSSHADYGAGSWSTPFNELDECGDQGAAARASRSHCASRLGWWGCIQGWRGAAHRQMPPGSAEARLPPSTVVVPRTHRAVRGADMGGRSIARLRTGRSLGCVRAGPCNWVCRRSGRGRGRRSGAVAESSGRTSRLSGIVNAARGMHRCGRGPAGDGGIRAKIRRTSGSNRSRRYRLDSAAGRRTQLRPPVAVSPEGSVVRNWLCHPRPSPSKGAERCQSIGKDPPIAAATASK